MMKRKLKKELKERRKGGKKTSKRWARGRDRCTHLVSSPWSTDRRAYACPSEELQTCQPFYISNVSLCLSAGVYVLACVPVWVQMCRDSVCAVWPATLHYFLCVLLNLFMPELALPVIHAQNARLAHRAQSGLHSSLPACCHLMPWNPHLI